jgi:hypothetical protein
MKRLLLIVFAIIIGVFLYTRYIKYTSKDNIEEYNQQLESTRNDEMKALNLKLDMQEGEEVEVEESAERSGIELFKDVPYLIGHLGLTGIGQLRSYKYDGYGYMASTDYFRFGSENSSGSQNNLAYYLEGNSRSEIDKLKIILNIFNPNERKEAIKKYNDLVTRAFKTIKVEIPKGMNNAILNGEDFDFENNKYFVVSKRMPGNIENYKMTIESK